MQQIPDVQIPIVPGVVMILVLAYCAALLNIITDKIANQNERKKMQVGGPSPTAKTWTEAQVLECLDHMETIIENQDTVLLGVTLIEEDTTVLQEQAARTHDFQLFLILLLTVHFGYLISHYFLPKTKQIGGPG